MHKENVSKLLLGLIVGLVLGGAGVWFYEQRHAEGKEEKKEEKKEEVSFVQHGTNGETFLKLDRETQARMGLKTAPLNATQSKPEVEAYGRVLDPAPLESLLIERASAKAAFDASSREFERLKLLHDQGQNASTRALETAQAAMAHDEILFNSIQPRLLLSWGKTIASLPDLPAFAHSLAAQETAVVRIDLPLHLALKSPPQSGRLAPLTAPEDLSTAQFLGPAPIADAQLQGQGFLFLQKSKPLPPGAAVLAWLSLPGEAESGVTLPRQAVVRHEGEVFVYLQSGDDIFTRKKVELDRPLENGWVVREGLKPQDKVVVVGVQQLLSEELKGQGAE